MSSICEIYPCIQGEGSRAGVPSILIRTLGCNLRCSWCDTPYTSWKPEKGNRTIEELYRTLDNHPQIEEVIITGGEPSICPDLDEIIQCCTDKRKRITLETNGTRLINEKLMKMIDLVSLSPKLSNSTPNGSEWTARHDKERIQPDILRQWIKQAVNYQLKFVVADPQDLDEILRLTEVLDSDNRNIYLMPEGRTEQELQHRRKWLAECCIQKGFCYGERLHIVIYGDKRGV